MENEYIIFEQYGLTREDFILSTFRHNIMDGDYKSGVEISVPQLEISIKCYSRKSQIQNRNKCLRIIKLIIDDIMKK